MLMSKTSRYMQKVVNSAHNFDFVWYIIQVYCRTNQIQQIKYEYEYYMPMAANK